MAQVVHYTEFGGPEVLRLVEATEPRAAASEVVVEVRAAGVNPIDWKIRSGLRPSGPITTPRRVGFDAAGTIVALGAKVFDWAVGDAVIVSGAQGAYASHLVARAGQLIPKPLDLGWPEAASLGVPAGTAYQAVRSLGVRAGETLLIHGGSGCVGQAAIQFARRDGATVIATASEANHARLTALGALPVAYGPGLVDRVRAAAPSGIDAVLDAAGTDEALDASFALVADRSRIGTIVVGWKAAELGILAWSGGNPIPLTPEQVQLRFDGTRLAAELAAAGRFDVEIAATFPLAEAAAAQSLSEHGHPRGKIVLLP
jgi:NADPH:quinone reductase-like Zn-dependent oxidoreductase